GLLPLVLSLALRGRPRSLLAVAACGIAAAEMGRRKEMGRTVFPPTSALWAPAWLAERAVTSWIALGTRLFLGGVRYRSGRLKYAATPRHLLDRNVREARKRPEGASAGNQGR